MIIVISVEMFNSLECSGKWQRARNQHEHFMHSFQSAIEKMKPTGNILSKPLCLAMKPLHFFWDEEQRKKNKHVLHTHTTMRACDCDRILFPLK